MPEPLRIVMADDNYLVREGTRRLHVNAIFTKLALTTEDLSHRRVPAVLTFLRDAGLRG